MARRGMGTRGHQGHLQQAAYPSGIGQNLELCNRGCDRSSAGRVQSGIYRIDSAPGSGTTVSGTLPVAELAHTGGQR